MIPSLDDEIEILLTYLGACEHRRSRLPALDVFDGAEPFSTGANAARMGVPIDEARRISEDVRSRESVADPRDTLIRPVVGMAFPALSNGDAGGFTLTRWRILAPAEYRGQIRFARHVVEATWGMISEAGDYQHGARDLLASNDWRKWVTTRGGVLPEAKRALEIMPAFAWRRARSWRVLIGMGEGPRISFGTSPDGAREVFRLRDVPPGKQRRAALRHWVRDHWRNKGTEHSVEVRRHLRGATNFTWSGMRCEIAVPPENMERELADFDAAHPAP